MGNGASYTAVSAALIPAQAQAKILRWIELLSHNSKSGFRISRGKYLSPCPAVVESLL
jgi:hypothetical protein